MHIINIFSATIIIIPGLIMLTQVYGALISQEESSFCEETWTSPYPLADGNVEGWFPKTACQNSVTRSQGLAGVLPPSLILHLTDLMFSELLASVIWLTSLLLENSSPSLSQIPWASQSSDPLSSWRPLPSLRL